MMYGRGIIFICAVAMSVAVITGCASFDDEKIGSDELKRYSYTNDAGMTTEVEYFQLEDGSRKVVKSSSWLSDGSLVNKNEHEYDDEGNRVKSIVYNESGLSMWIEYEYDADNIERSGRVFGADGSLHCIIVKEYDVNGDISDVRFFSPDSIEMDLNELSVSWEILKS